MNRRLRLVAALLALVAFSAYVAESVATPFCGPASEQAGSEHAAHVGAGDHHDHSESHHSDASHEAPCPMSFGGATCVAVSLPARAASVQLLPAEVEGEFTRDQAGTSLLLIHTIYHPPRA